MLCQYREHWAVAGISAVFIITQKMPYVHPMLVYCWATVCDAGPALNQHCVNVKCLMKTCWQSVDKGKVRWMDRWWGGGVRGWWGITVCSSNQGGWHYKQGCWTNVGIMLANVEDCNATLRQRWYDMWCLIKMDAAAAAVVTSKTTTAAAATASPTTTAAAETAEQQKHQLQH